MCFEICNRYDWLWKLGYLEEKFFVMGVMIIIFGFFFFFKVFMIIKIIMVNCYVLIGFVMFFFVVIRYFGFKLYGLLFGMIFRIGIIK